eukprot:TRINITY_DN14221_c0_g1_i1.p1 TRINITY_DN14221_c0_g1~~TRINITY_DN14221_c0_g1_i1.p1  ORF type:complete len:349 (+),score=27.73 TRINITY_DN14221_c0_g1_i1:2-1048(+)
MSENHTYQNSEQCRAIFATYPLDSWDTATFKMNASVVEGSMFVPRSLADPSTWLFTGDNGLQVPIFALNVKDGCLSWVGTVEPLTPPSWGDEAIWLTAFHHSPGAGVISVYNQLDVRKFLPTRRSQLERATAPPATEAIPTCPLHPSKTVVPVLHGGAIHFPDLVLLKGGAPVRTMDTFLIPSAKLPEEGEEYVFGGFVGTVPSPDKLQVLYGVPPDETSQLTDKLRQCMTENSLNYSKGKVLKYSEDKGIVCGDPNGASGQSGGVGIPTNWSPDYPVFYFCHFGGPSAEYFGDMAINYNWFHTVLDKTFVKWYKEVVYPVLVGKWDTLTEVQKQLITEYMTATGGSD